MSDFLSRLFLESPLYLGVFSFLLFAVVLLLRVRWESQSARRYALPLTLLTILLLFVIQKLVVTQRELLIDTLRDLVDAVEREDVAALATFVSNAYDSEDLDRQAFIQHATAALEIHDIRDSRLSRFNARIQRRTARLRFAARSTVAPRGQAGRLVFSSWQIDWVLEPGGWKITAVRPVQIDGYHFDSLRNLPGLR